MPRRVSLGRGAGGAGNPMTEFGRGEQGRLAGGADAGASLGGDRGAEGSGRVCALTALGPSAVSDSFLRRPRPRAYNRPINGERRMEGS